MNPPSKVNWHSAIREAVSKEIRRLARIPVLRTHKNLLFKPIKLHSTAHGVQDFAIEQIKTAAQDYEIRKGFALDVMETRI
jgi:hypothetical protein